MPDVASRFGSYRAYAEAVLSDVLTADELAEARRLEARLLETSLFVGRRGGRFERRPLPVQAQFSPVFAAEALDYDGDGNRDLVLGGNLHDARVRFGRYDASYGMLLRGDGQGGFAYVPQHTSGLGVRGDHRRIVALGRRLLFGVYGRPLQAYAYDAPAAAPDS